MHTPAHATNNSSDNSRHDSFGNKLKREAAMVAGGTVDGIAEAARDAWSHKGQSALKFGASAVVGAGASIAMAELGLPALAITGLGVAAAVVTGKELAGNGGKAVSAMKDCWKNPTHCDADREVFKNSVGKPLFDTALYTAGGIAAGSAARVVPVAMKEFSLMKQLKQFHPETAEHSMRVAQYSRLTTKELGLPRSVQGEAYHAGKMHDIGKLNVSKDVLNKPSELNNDEFLAIKRHPGSSQSILENVPYKGSLKKVAQAAGSHHERIDGKGYPNQLRGDQISPVAKTLAPADVFDALTAGRAYSRGERAAFERMPLGQVKKTMDANAGTQFDYQSLKAMWNVPANRMVGVLESADRRPHVGAEVLRKFEGVRFGRLLDILNGAPGTTEEKKLAQLLDQLYLTR